MRAQRSNPGNWNMLQMPDGTTQGDRFATEARDDAPRLCERSEAIRLSSFPISYQIVRLGPVPAYQGIRSNRWVVEG